MINKVTEYSTKSEPKICVECGNKIEEQRESYMYQCEHCLRNVSE